MIIEPLVTKIIRSQYHIITHHSWWHHEIESLSALLALYKGPLVESTHKWAVWCFLCLERKGWDHVYVIRQFKVLSIETLSERKNNWQNVANIYIIMNKVKKKNPLRIGPLVFPLMLDWTNCYANSLVVCGLTQIGHFRTVTPVWIHQRLRPDAQSLKQHKRGALFFSRSSIKFQGHTAQNIANFDPNWKFPDCNSSLNSPMALKWWTKLNVV